MEFISAKEKICNGKRNIKQIFRISLSLSLNNINRLEKEIVKAIKNKKELTGTLFD